MINQKNLLFDNLIFTLQANGGGSTYWYEILSRVSQDDFNLRELNYPSQELNRLYKLYYNDNLTRGYAPKLVDRYLERFRPPINPFSPEKVIFHSSYYRVLNAKNAKNVLTIHDFIPELYFNNLRKNYNKCRKKISLSAADSIICVSDSTKNDLLNFFPKVNSNKVSVIHNGVSGDFCHLNYTRQNYIMFVGSRFTYKNFRWSVKAVSLVKNMDLYIVGAKLNTEEYAYISSFKNLRYKVFTDISNDELNDLYNSAFALVYPSDYEGFGLPVVEAMKSGCPVIARNRSSIPEISPVNNLLLDDFTFDEFLDKCGKLFTDYENYQNSALKNAKRFSWDYSYEKHKSIYNSL